MLAAWPTGQSAFSIKTLLRQVDYHLVEAVVFFCPKT